MSHIANVDIEDIKTAIKNLSPDGKQELASRIGVHWRTLYRWADGTSKINRGWAELLSKELAPPATKKKGKK